MEENEILHLITSCCTQKKFPHWFQLLATGSISHQVIYTHGDVTLCDLLDKALVRFSCCEITFCTNRIPKEVQYTINFHASHIDGENGQSRISKFTHIPCGIPAILINSPKGKLVILGSWPLTPGKQFAALTLAGAKTYDEMMELVRPLAHSLERKAKPKTK